MNSVKAIGVIIMSFCMWMHTELLCNTVMRPHNVTHCVLALPEGIACVPVVNDDARTVTCTFPGLSLVHLREHCLQYAADQLPFVSVCTRDGVASLVFDVASFAHPVVTITLCSLSHHVIIGVHEQSAPQYSDSSSGMIVHSI